MNRRQFVFRTGAFAGLLGATKLSGLLGGRRMSAASLQARLDEAALTGAPVLLPAGVVVVDQTLRVTGADTVIAGLGSGRTVLQADSGLTGPVLALASGAPGRSFTLRGLAVHGTQVRTRVGEGGARFARVA